MHTVLNRRTRRVWVGLAAAFATAALFAQTPTDSPAHDQRPPERLGVDEARRQAELLHKTYSTILREVHRRYYEEDEGLVIPARTLEDVFKEVDAGTQRETRWIAVNTAPMNVDHKPRAGFETKSAERLGEGEEFYEAVENGIYHRAGVVPLKGGCLQCHVSALTKGVSTPRVAGFVVSIPVDVETNR